MTSAGDIVMVVEDEEDARAFLVQILELEGYKALGFANGAEALQYLEQSEEPCIIILDLRMPVMDGPAFRVAQQKDPRLANIPVVVVTALDPAAAANLSALRVLRKPVDIEALVDLVRKHC
jgi:CheY-like chemotaxis protein